MEKKKQSRSWWKCCPGNNNNNAMHSNNCCDEFLSELTLTNGDSPSSPSPSPALNIWIFLITSDFGVGADVSAEPSCRPAPPIIAHPQGKQNKTSYAVNYACYARPETLVKTRRDPETKAKLKDVTEKQQQQQQQTVTTMKIPTNIRNTNRATESSANTQNVPWSVLGSPLRGCWIVRFQFDVWNFAAIKARALGSVNHISLSFTSRNNPPKKQSKMFKFVSSKRTTTKKGNWLIQLVQRKNPLNEKRKFLW